MYVKASVIADHPVRESIAALLEEDEAWFPHLVQSVGESSGTHLVAVGFTLAGVPIQKKVEVELGPIRHELDWLRVGVSWRPASAAAMFPSMDGEFHLEPNTYRDTRVTVSGSYVPPLGLAGHGLDVALMHRVAEATFKDLAIAIAAELDRRLAAR
jgi:hypothetical protein